MEPARKHSPDIDPEIRPRLGVIQGGGESTDDRGNLQEANKTSSELTSAEKRLGVIQGGGESTDDRGDLKSVREKEEDMGLFKPSGDKGKKSSPKKLSVRGVLQSRKAASGGLIGILIALLGGISMFVTPGLAAVQMKEILTDDLNDQLGAMDRRSVYVMRAKLNDMGKGICTGVKIRCGFKGMSDRQVSKFVAAGIEVETDGKTITGKNNIKSLTFTAIADGEVCDGCGDDKVKITNPKELDRYLAYPNVRNQLRKAFNPKFAGFFDAKWDNFKQKYNLTSKDKIGAGSDEEKRQAVTSAAQGDPIDAKAPDARPTTNEDGSPNTENEDANRSAERSAAAANADGVSTKTFLGAGAKGAIKGVGALGSIDVGCTIKNTARAVEAGAKIYRYRQLMAYSMVFLTFADQIKDGTATPDQAEFVGNTLTAVDTEEKVFDETSPLDGEEPKEVENQYYGANAFDSAGYKTAMYNEAPTLSARDMQMAVGGGMALSMLGDVNNVIEKLGGNKCKYVQNWAVRGGSLIAGIALGAVTLGAWTAASVGASVAISMALPILENYLAQMTSGTVADGNTKGVDAGNAIFAGAAALMGGMAMSRGMKPATKSDLKSYLALNEEVKNEYIALETEDARKTPFDVNNRYSFMGSLTRTLLPVRTTSSVSVGNALFNGIGSILAAPHITPSALASSEYNEERYSKCEDNGYNKLGIDADVFCNVRYALSPYELGLDTEEVRAQMLAWGQVNDDEEGSVVTDSDYAKWLTECTEREEGWGETPDPEKPDDGDGMRCMSNEKKDSYYRVYTMDASIIAAMDYIPPTGTTSEEATGGAEFRIASYNILGKSHTAGDSWIGRADKVVGNITTNNIDIIGFQEYEAAQREYISKGLPGYTTTTHGKLDDGIMWNSEKFSLVNKGTWQTTYFTKGNDEPWIKLKYNETGQEFYVMNVHDPINREEGDAQTRADNAREHLELIKKLQAEAPVLLTGDFNNGYEKSDGAGMASNEETAYCQLSSSGLMIHAYDAASDRKYKCPNPLPKEASISTTIDHIYISTGMDATEFFDIEKDAAGSDHPAVVADVSIPAVGAGTGAGTDFVIATYNHPARGDSSKAIEAINSRKFDVVGMQELSGSNYGALRNNLKKSGYGIYPDLDKNVPAVGCSSDHAVFYKTDKFKLIKEETFSFPRYEHYRAVANCGNGESKAKGDANAPVLWLEDIRPQYQGQVIIVINTHNIANVASADRPSLRRYQAAKIYVEKIAEYQKENPGVPIFFTGDFNEGTAVRTAGMGNITYEYDQPGAHNNLLYCMFTQNKLMLAVNKSNTCPDLPARRTPVDFIYHTPGVKVESHGEFIDPSTNDSPHPVQFAHLTVPGSADPATTGSTGSDIAGNDYARECDALIGASNCSEQCVAFVKFRLVKHGVLSSPISLGNGGEVTSTLGRLGFKVNTTPAVHSVMSLRHSYAGHTAMVSQVNPDGSIVVEEYNWPGGEVYGKRTISAATLQDYRSKDQLTFAHTETKYQ